MYCTACTCSQLHAQQQQLSSFLSAAWTTTSPSSWHFPSHRESVLCCDHRYRKRWAHHYCVGALEMVSCGTEGTRAWAPTGSKWTGTLLFAQASCLCQILERCPGGCCCQQWKGQGVQGGGCSWWLPPSQSSSPSLLVPLQSPALELPFQTPTQPINPILWQQPSGPHHQAHHVQLGLSCWAAFP